MLYYGLAHTIHMKKVTEIGVIKLCFNRCYIFLLTLTLSPPRRLFFFPRSPHLFRGTNNGTEISSVTTNIPSHSEQQPVIKVGDKIMALDVHFSLAFL